MASGYQLGVDLNQLYRTAHYLSRVSGDFKQASSLVNVAAPAQSGWWQTTVPEWGMLQFEICDVLSDTSTNLSDTATQLNQTANNYAATDQAAAQEFTTLQQQDTSEQGWS
jgi:hypothetical protein